MCKWANVQISALKIPIPVIFGDKQIKMDRRKFLRNGSLTGMGLAGIGRLSLDALPAEELQEKQTALELEEITVTELQRKMQNGEESSVSITRAYLERIKEIDKAGPMLNSIIELNPDALSIAENLDKERKQGKIRGPLHGIPILVKDNINTGDQMMTTAGSLALIGNHAKEDAFVMKQLRNAGVVLLGKTNLSEWANFRSTHSCSGWSSRGGQTKSPYILDRNPSGSSAGSGSAGAANLSAICVGTETDGSVVSPASVNALVGIKPTVGLWSRTGIIPISATQDTAGPMTRSVQDAAILLGAGTGTDESDLITKESAGKSLKDYTVYLKKDGLKDKRIGIEKSHLTGNPDLVALLRAAMMAMEAQGATLVEVDVMGPLKLLGTAEYQVLLYEFKDGLNKYLGSANGKVKSLKDLIAFNLENETKLMPFFKQEILVESEAKGGLDSKEYIESLAKTLGFRKTILDLLALNKLDALSGMTNGPACCIDLANGDYDNGPSLSTPAAITGFPHITVPMGLFHGLPIGLSFYAGAYTEPLLISLAYSYEQASLKRRKPGYRNVVNVEL
jgi:amidase